MVGCNATLICGSRSRLNRQMASGLKRPHMAMFETTLMCNIFCEYCIFGEEGGFMEHALARGAKIYAETPGYGLSSDAGYITQPSLDGPARAIGTALNEAGANPDQVDYINAHGTATRLNDLVEAQVIKKLFGDHPRRIAISSAKSMHGHALGARAAIELVATVLAIEKSAIPSTANYTQPDPECDLDYVPSQAQERRVRVAISNPFALGGLNAVLLVRRVE